MTQITLLWGHQTHKGPVFIGQTPDGRFHPVWKGESLGSYHSTQSAIENAAGGHAVSPSDGTDLGKLGISSDLGDWRPASTFA